MGRQKRIAKIAKLRNESNSKQDELEGVKYNHPLPVGLKNLGNTCFYNTVVQCLCQTNTLWNVLKDEKRRSELGEYRTITSPANDATLKYEIPQLSSLLTTCFHLLNKVYLFNEDNDAMADTKARRQKNSNRVINPSALFNEVAQKSKRFRACDQDDCMSFFSTLLSLASEEDKKAQKGNILKALGLRGMKAASVADEMKAKVKNYGIQIDRNYLSPLDRVFFGKYINHLRCDTCHMLKRSEERFNSLALSVCDLATKQTSYSNTSSSNKNGKHKSNNQAANDDEDSGGDWYKKSNNGQKDDAPAPRSKHMEKKAKKQARREAKYQKRHIKYSTINKKPTAVEEEKVDEAAGEEIKVDQNGGTPPTTENNATDSDVKNGNNDHTPVTNVQQGDEHSSTSQETDIISNSKVDDRKLSNNNKDDGDKADRNNGDVENGKEIVVEKITSFSSKKSIGDSQEEGDNNNGAEEEKILNQATVEDEKPSEKVPQSTEESSESRDLSDLSSGESNCGDDVTINRFAALQLTSDDDEVIKDDENKLLGGMGVLNKNDPSEDISTEEILNENDENNVEDDDGKGDTDEQDNEKKSPDITAAAEEEKEKTAATKKKSMTGESWFMNSNHVQMNQVFKVEKSDLPMPLSEYYEEAKPKECSIQLALQKYFREEHLTGDNQNVCETCTKRHHAKGGKNELKTDQRLRALISHPPPVLCLQMKIFGMRGKDFKKINKHVEVPTMLDISPYCVPEAQIYSDGGKILYELFAIIEHQGALNHGHYTCYVKRRSTSNELTNKLLNHELLASSTDNNATGLDSKVSSGRWFHISDERVQQVSESKVLSSNAYVVFYERVIN